VPDGGILRGEGRGKKEEFAAMMTNITDGDD
jgi:hypothetical protein